MGVFAPVCMFMYVGWQKHLWDLQYKMQKTENKTEKGKIGTRIDNINESQDLFCF